MTYRGYTLQAPFKLTIPRDISRRVVKLHPPNLQGVVNFTAPASFQDPQLRQSLEGTERLLAK